MKEALYSVSMANMLFFSILLFAVKRGNHSANRWLAVFFLISASLLLQAVFEYNGFYNKHPALLEVFTPLLFLWGTTYYFYIRTLIETAPKRSWIDILHGVPTLLCFFFYCPLYWSAESEKLHYLRRLMNDQPTGYDEAMGLSLLHFIIYLACSFRFVNDHQKRVANYFSGDLRKRNLSWLLALNYALLFIWLLWANFHLNEIFPSYVPALPLIRDLTPIFLIIILFSLGYYAVNQNAIFPPEITLNTINEPADVRNENEQIDATVAAEKKELVQKVVEVMSDQKHYRNPDLTLPELANHLNVSTNILSDVINKGIGENFYDFVNRHRVEECKTLLVDSSYEHYTTLGIGFEAGFNSKSTFHKAFKSLTGQSPARYRKEMQKLSPTL